MQTTHYIPVVDDEVAVVVAQWTPAKINKTLSCICLTRTVFCLSHVREVSWLREEKKKVRRGYFSERVSEMEEHHSGIN